jgi:hypothetical protein
VIQAWHFTGDTLRDKRPIPAVGEWLEHEGEIRICKTGLHASVKLYDALGFAPGNMLHRVTCDGVEGEEADKIVCRRRRVDWSMNAEPVLRAFSRRCALDVAHLWDMPEIVREYLETGNEELRAAAWNAVMDAARAAARAAAWDAAWNAARDPAWSAAWAAARAAAWAAARDAAIEKYNGWLTEMVEAAHTEETK